MLFRSRMLLLSAAAATTTASTATATARWTGQDDPLHLEAVFRKGVLGIALVGSPERLGGFARFHRLDRIWF